jgi:homospermidine synthase
MSKIVMLGYGAVGKCALQLLESPGNLPVAAITVVDRLPPPDGFLTR